MPSLQADRAAAWQAAAPAVELWRDYDPAARRLPGMSLGTRVFHGSARTAVTEWYDAGARCMRLPEPVRLCADAPPESARALLLVREATSRGFAVLWSAYCADGCAAGRPYHHLHPPTALTGLTGLTGLTVRTGAVPAEEVPAEEAPAEEVLAGWRTSYFPSKCVFRRGPGFVEVRDRRFGSLELFTIDEPGHLDAIDALTDGVPVADVPAGVRRDFAEAGLIAEHAGHAWWLPMRVRRWPFPSLTI